METQNTTRIFGGPAYSPALDHARLAAQIERIRALALRIGWFSLREIKAELERAYAPAVFPESSVSAQLRNLKKAPYRHVLEKRRRIGVHGPGAGIWEYRLLKAGLRPPPPEKSDAQSLAAGSRGPAFSNREDGQCGDSGQGRLEFLEALREIAGKSAVRT